MQVYVVSLKHSTDRQRSIRYQCERLGIKPIFIDAIYGEDLSKFEINQYCNQEKAKQLFGRELLSGEIGCALSHKKIYEKMISEEIKYAVILEDDAIVDKSVVNAIQTCTCTPFKWDLILFGHYATYNKSKAVRSQTSFWGKKNYKDLKFYRLVGRTSGTHGYMITYEGARKLYSKLNKITKPIDYYTSDDTLLDIYALYPTLINPNITFESYIDKDNNQRNNKVLFMNKNGRIYRFVHYFWKTYKKFRIIRSYK